MVKRERVDLSNVNLITGMTGRFTTVNCVPVIAGDSIGARFNGVCRISPMRRNVVLDPQVDVVSFYVPHRHIYSNWDDYIAHGPEAEGAPTLESVTLSDVAKFHEPEGGNDYYERPWWIPWGKDISYDGADKLPKWMVQPMINFWNRFGRLPKIGLDEVAIGDAGFGASYFNGFPSARMPHIWSRLHESSSEADGVEVSDSTVRLSDIAKQATLFKRDQQDEWAVNYADDILRGRFGGRMNTDADQRPDIVAHTTQRLSGFNIYGTAGETAKGVTGRYEGYVEHGWRRRFFPEHGSLWTVMVVRFPEIAVQEQHYLADKATPTYKEFACDPDVLDTELPEQVDAADFFAWADPADWSGYCPYGEWFRSQPNVVSKAWAGQQTNAAGIGYPVRPRYPDSLIGAAMQCSSQSGQPFENDDVFYGSTELNQFNVTGKTEMDCFRCAPSAWSSIYSASDIDD